ncbi:hypothetical protein ACFPOA_15920 [Lysobacter niabensis]|uniref:hypothetical protein n=1 Tax=Agrilutibacter niabensis TaxID=380628 RepID=UPI00361CF86B
MPKPLRGSASSGVMRLEKLHTGFSTADTSYPELVYSPGQLSVRFNSSSGHPVRVEFSGVAAFSWQENNDSLFPGEPWDGPCELFDSPLMALHPTGFTLHSVAGLRHIRFNFNAWGRLDVLCVKFSAAA